MDNSSLISKSVLPVDSHNEISFPNEAGFQGNTLLTPALSSSHLTQPL